MYSLAAIKIGNTVIGQVNSQEMDPGIQQIVLGGGGRVDPTFAGVTGANPRPSFTSTALKPLLDLAGIGGLAITAASPFTMWWRRRKSEGIWDDAAAVKEVVTRALLYPTRMEATHGGDPATISYELATIADGANSPRTVAIGQAFSADWPTVEEFWGLGPAFINNVRADLEQSMQIDFGLEVNTIGGGGSVWPKEVHIRGRRPTISFNTLDMGLLGDTDTPGTTIGLGPVGIEIDDARETSVFLRKFKGPMYEADAETKHIALRVHAGRVTPQSYSGEHGSDASLPVLITGIKDDTTGEAANAIMTVNTARAIDVAETP